MKVVQLAKQEASRLDHDVIEPGHVLLAMIKENGPAAKFLGEKGIDIRVVRLWLETFKALAIMPNEITYEPLNYSSIIVEGKPPIDKPATPG